ncbi:ATP-binding protein, partial [Clostridioides difficile]|nr:ATP-binding protein [Clostridioides difficile]
MDYVVLPLDSFLFSLFLVLAVLLLNSVYFDSREGHILWGTVTQFSLFLLLREVCFVLLGLFGLSTGFWPIYGVRMLPLLFWAALWSTGMLRWMKEQLEEGDIPLCIVVGNTFLVLLMIW